MFVITGGGRGLGRELAVQLASRGKKVLIVGRKLQSLQEVAAASSNISFLQVDVTKNDARQELADYLQNYELQGLVHNAGIVSPLCKINAIAIDDLQQTFATNVEAPLALTQLLLPKLSQARILNISSGAAHFAIDGMAAYCASKAALLSFMRSWRLEYPNLAIGSVRPGIVDTAMMTEIRTSKHMRAKTDEFFQDLKTTNRLVQPNVVGSFLTWLLLDISSEQFTQDEWDIYNKHHHHHWLQAGQSVPDYE